MRLFKNKNKANESFKNKKSIWVNSNCPFNGVLCGNWCSLFFTEKIAEGSKPYVILGCKGTDKRLYVDEVVE